MQSVAKNWQSPIREEHKSGQFPLHPLSNIQIAIDRIVAISPTRSGSRILLNDGDIFFLRASPERLYQDFVRTSPIARLNPSDG